MNAKELTQALNGKWNGYSGIAPCPAHDDQKPSLSISEQGGKLLVKCHAGCGQDNVISALSHRGLWGKRAVATKWHRERLDTDQKSEAQTRYERQQRAMSILYKAARPKGRIKPGTKPDHKKLLRPYLKSRGLDDVAFPKGLMFLSATDAKAVGLPFMPHMIAPVVRGRHLLGCSFTALTQDKKGKAKAAKNQGPIQGGYIQLGRPMPDKPLLVAEGIETALSASLITGLPSVATCGAGNMPLIQLPRCGAVIIAADNDEAGQTAAEALATTLAGVGKDVRIAYPKGKGEDWNDALLAAADYSALKSEILKAPVWDEKPELDLMTAPAFLELNLPPREMLLAPWLPAAGMAMIFAPPGHGKTRLALSVGYAVATGDTLMNWVAEREANVAYVDGELSYRECQDKVRDLGPPSDRMRVLTSDMASRADEDMINLTLEGDRDWLDDRIKAHQLELIILDSQSTLGLDGMNTEEEIKAWAAISKWAAQHKSAGRTLLFIHHAGKSGDQLGSMQKEIRLDTIIRLERDENLSDDTTTAFKLQFRKCRGFYGADARSFTAQFCTQSGIVEWTREEIDERGNKEKIAEMLHDKMRPIDIAKKLGVTKQYVSKVQKDLQNRSDF